MLRQETRNRVAKNTLILYARQITILLVNLYLVRAGLNILGVEDFGIYNVVAGIVTFFSFLGGSMASATQRFFAFALGQKDYQRLQQIFTVNAVIYAGIVVIAIIALETVGLWFISTQLNIPADRSEAVQWLYQLSSLTFYATMVSTLFMAIVIAHEDMKIYAYVSTLEVFLKLALVILLEYMVGDKLILYGLMIFIVSCITSVLYAIFCMQKYQECQLRIMYWDKELFREIVGFTSWTLFGQLSTVGRNQAVTILLNQTFNPVVVAARSIAVNVATQINVFANNFSVGLYPALIKSYAEKNSGEMFALIFGGSRATFILMWLPALPIFLEMDLVLKLWLINPPDDAVLFTRLALVEALIMSISLPIGTAARAPGKMRLYELTLGSIQLGVFFASWIALAAGAPAYSVFVIAIAANLLMMFTRLFIVKGLIGLPVRRYLREVLTPITSVALLSGSLGFGLHASRPDGIAYALLSTVFSVGASSLIMYFLGLNASERTNVKSMVMRRLRRTNNNAD